MITQKKTLWRCLLKIMRKAEYKPLLFTTTVRNPLRFKYIIEILLSYDGQILTNYIIDKIIFELVARKIYIPVYGKTIESHDDRFSDADTFSIMICPNIHSDTRIFAEFIKFKNNLDIILLETASFINTLGKLKSVRFLAGHEI